MPRTRTTLKSSCFATRLDFVDSILICQVNVSKNEPNQTPADTCRPTDQLTSEGLRHLVQALPNCVQLTELHLGGERRLQYGYECVEVFICKLMFKL